MKRYGWSREYRISKSRDFQFLKRHSKRLFTEHFEIWFYRQDRKFPPVRLAVVVRKKHGKAVRRNRIRRIVREFFRLNQHDLPPGDYVVIVRKMPFPLRYASVEEELRGVFNKFG